MGRKDHCLVVRCQRFVGRLVLHLVLGGRHHAPADAHLLLVLQGGLVHLEDLENEGSANSVDLGYPLPEMEGKSQEWNWWKGLSANRRICGEAFCIRLMKTLQKLAASFSSLSDRLSQPSKI